MRNDFTLSLLNYSAERDDCIGRPEGWGSPPPLVVDTPLHEEMGALAEYIWAGPSTLIWYFLVGGPGNGKSEAVGAFVRRLNTEARQAGQPPVFDAANGQGGGSIPHWFPGVVPHGQIMLLQDISVPKHLHSDPAADFLDCLDLCADPGAHLLACANRGMLLRATRRARRESSCKWLVPILESIDKQSQEAASPEGAKWTTEANGKKIEIHVWPIDHESVLFGQGAGNPWADPTASIFDQIIAKAVAQEHWEDSGCTRCPARELCPMLGDALWLRGPGRRRSALQILRYAEVWSGQRIVLREALGFLSMLLVGCPSDFVEDGIEVHPCEWVQERTMGAPAQPKDERALIDLISHRIYQDFFGRAAPTGLTLDRASQRRDEWVLERLAPLGSGGRSIATALREVDATFPKQAGPLRLIGRDGILRSFDPAIDVVWCSKHGLTADSEISELRKLGVAHQGELERQLGDLLEKLESATRALPPHNDPARSFAAIYRWASTLYLRLAGVALGEAPNAANLENYLALLQQPSRPIHADETQTTLRELMKSVGDTDRNLSLAPSFAAELPSLQLKAMGARPRSATPRWPANDRLVLQVSAGPTSGPYVLLGAATFVDTWRKQVRKIAEWNISPAMEDLMRLWRDDFVVTKGQFRNLQAVEFTGGSVLEFEFISATDIQVRSK